jgi:hypothetical protein
MKVRIGGVWRLLCGGSCSDYFDLLVVMIIQQCRFTHLQLSGISKYSLPNWMNKQFRKLFHAFFSFN